MVCKREHVHGLNALYAVAAAEKNIEVTALSFNIAGDIDNLFRRALYE